MAKAVLTTIVTMALASKAVTMSPRCRSGSSW
jgi:hypothetical protein